ncbi:MAG: hypothetical protein HQM09_25075 [Candidatus Riflebacteria bacterium]|nr:hypothetical protein [Candidatus Riflebacteria bacterium]
MPRQGLLPGFPEGATKIGKSLSILKKEGQITYFVGGDNYFSHRDGDLKSQRFALATLMGNGHVRPCELEGPPLFIPHRTAMNWAEQLREQGPGSFFRPRCSKNVSVMRSERIAECEKHLQGGMSVSKVAELVGVGESTLRKAIQRGAVSRAPIEKSKKK